MESWAEKHFQPILNSMGMIISRKISIPIICAIVSVALAGCPKPAPDTASATRYVLPDEHIDNQHQLKPDFFREPFVDMNGKEWTIADFRGTPLVIMMYPSFRTEKGRVGLLGLEMLVKERRGQFYAIVVPFESMETIRPAIKSEMEGLSFFFRANGKPNDTLIDRYSDFFWDERIISIDYPDNPASLHHSCPFYWIVDRSGRIREKLIDYSNRRGVRPVEVATVLDALLGVRIFEPEPPVSSVESDIETSPDSSESSD
mgnify:CR=1 FL=1